jgi:hypothetical protein
VSRRSALLLVSILAVSVLLRLAVAVYLGDSVPPGKDETSYSVLGGRVAAGYGYTFPEPWYPFARANEPTSHWSFLYTAFVAAIYWLVGVHPLAVRLTGAVLGGLMLPWLVYRLARRALPDRGRVALLAAGCAAFYAYFILFAAQLMTETFYISCVLWSLERALALAQALARPGRAWLTAAAGLGISLGLATLLRQSIMPWIAVLCLWLVWRGYRQGQIRRALLSAVAAGLIVLAMILPFTVRNYLAYGDFLLLNSNAGYAMYSAQHPLHGTSFQAFTAAPLPADLLGVAENEAQWDRLLMARGFQFIFDDPQRYVLLSASRVADFFMFWPSGETIAINNIGRVASFGLFLPVMAYGLWLSRGRWRELQLLYLFMVFYTVLHLLTWAMIRYRLPVDAVLLIFAALALARLSAGWSIWDRLGLGPDQATGDETAAGRPV